MYRTTLLKMKCQTDRIGTWTASTKDTKGWFIILSKVLYVCIQYFLTIRRGNYLEMMIGPLTSFPE